MRQKIIIFTMSFLSTLLGCGQSSVQYNSPQSQKRIKKMYKKYNLPDSLNISVRNKLVSADVMLGIKNSIAVWNHDPILSVFNFGDGLWYFSRQESEAGLKRQKNYTSFAEMIELDKSIVPLLTTLPAMHYAERKDVKSPWVIGKYNIPSTMKKYVTKYFGAILIDETEMNSDIIRLLLDYKGEMIRITLLNSARTFNECEGLLDLYIELIDRYFEIDKIARTSILNRYSVNDIFGFVEVPTGEDAMDKLGYPVMAISTSNKVGTFEKDKIEVSVFYSAESVTKEGYRFGQNLTVRMDEKLNVTEVSMSENVKIE